MRRKRTIALLTLSAAAFAALGAACSSGHDTYEFPYEETKKPSFEEQVTLDAGSAIDGVKDSFYGDSAVSFTETKSGIKVTTWAHIGENGLYLYSEADDTSVYHSDEKAFYENDSIEFYIDPNPDYSATVEALNGTKGVRTDCVQVRINTLGDCQTWYGRYTGKNNYPWVQGHFVVKTAAKVNGEMNKAGGAQGYSVEAFLPYESLSLTEKPTAIGVMPAFNNVNNREDTSRSWFTVKGMSHAKVTGYARVESEGFVDIGLNDAPEKALTASASDGAYTDEISQIVEVDEENANPETRATIKTMLGNDGVYFLATVKDKAYTNGSDSLWSNDGIEILIDITAAGGDSSHRNGIFRVGVDIDGGIETDIGMNGYNDYVPVRRATFVKTSVSDYAGESKYGYRYTYVYEVMVPYESLGLTKKPEKLAVAWAVKTPNEKAYILDRKDGSGKAEAQDWLWADKHYPNNPGEYYLVLGGLKPWNECTVQADASERYNYRGYAAADGLYLNMVQYVDNVVTTGDAWTEQTHIEMEIWQDDLGYGWGGTYFALSASGWYYYNYKQNNPTADCPFQYRVTIKDLGESATYRYQISYEIYIGFANSGDDGPYAYVQFMSFTPNETEGYTNATTINKDGRTLYTDDCKSYRIDSEKIAEKMYT